MFGTLRQDLGFSARTLLKNTGFTLTAVLTLALGIGATSAMFSVVYADAIKRAPREPEAVKLPGV